MVHFLRHIAPLLLVIGVLVGGTQAQGASLGKELVTQAQRAILRGHVSRGIVLLRAAREINNNISILKQLARANTLSGQFGEAIENYKLILERRPPAQLRRFARSEITRLKQAPAPFSDQLPTRPRMTVEAKSAFAKGVRLARGKKYSKAVQFLKAALVLDPVIPGPYRLLGVVHGKLKDPAKERAFLEDYLRIRPEGAIAAEVRRRLRPSNVLAKVKVTASYPCDVWINGRPMGLKTAVNELLLPKGSHTISFVNAKHHVIRNIRIRLKRREKAVVDFQFGVLEVALRPWARLRANGRDLGLWRQIGMPVGSYTLEMVAHDGSKRGERVVRIRAANKTRVDSW